MSSVLARNGYSSAPLLCRGSAETSGKHDHIS
jgi:hypothetical protein